MAFDPKTVQPGDVLSASAWNEIGAAIKAGTRISGGAGIFARNAGNGLELAVAQPDEMDFQITDGPDANGGYDWVRVVHSSAGDGVWVQTEITGGSATMDPVYPRQFGLPKPAGRALVLVPPVFRDGKHIIFTQAWLSFGLGQRLQPDGTVFHAVRADGDSQWVFDPVSPDISSTEEMRVYVCCDFQSSSSSSSTSTSGDHCAHCDSDRSLTLALDVCPNCGCNTPKWFDVSFPAGGTPSGNFCAIIEDGTLCQWNFPCEAGGTINVLPGGICQICVSFDGGLTVCWESAFAHGDCRCPTQAGFSGSSDGSTGYASPVSVNPHYDDEGPC